MKQYMIPLVRQDGYLLRGLSNLPFGLWLIAWSTSGFVWPSGSALRVSVGTIPEFISLVIAILAALALRRYYRATGGSPPGMFKNRIVPAVILLAVAVPALVGGREPPFSAWGVLLGLIFLVFGNRSSFYTIAGLALIAVSAGLPFLAPGYGGNLVIGLILGCTITIGSV